MRVSALRAPVNYMLATGSVLVTVALAIVLRDLLGNSPELLFVPSVVFSSFLCGLGPGVASGLLSVGALIYLFEPPLYSFAIDSIRDILDIVVFSLVAISINGLNAARQRAEKILQNILPVCAWCRKIRREDQWINLETYARLEMNTSLTHSICPDCRKRMAADL